jgi:hypothetical protein
VPNAHPARTAREFCSVCGFPVRGVRCDACGAAHESSSARHGGEESSRPFGQAYVPPDLDGVGLEAAIEAHRAHDTPRFVEQTLRSEVGGAVRAVPVGEGTGWIATIRGSLVFAQLRSEEIVLEAPLARLSRQKRMPCLRVALEMCAEEKTASRVCLRGELLLLRVTARLAVLTPLLLRQLVREVGQTASRHATVLRAGFDAAPAITDESRATVGFEVLGRVRRIQFGGPRSFTPGPVATGHMGAPRIEEAAASVPESIPPILAAGPPPASASSSEDARRAPTASAIRPPRPPPLPSSSEATSAPRPLPRAEASRPEVRIEASRSEASRIEASRHDASRAEGSRPDLDEASSRRASSASFPEVSAVRPSPPDATISPPDRLCILLRQAQALASMTLQERPASLSWVVRSTVFRAVYDFREALPDAVAHLYRATGMGRDAKPSSRSGELAAAEPALVVMDRVVAARGTMPREAALVIEPLTTAAQAKEHVASFLAEIDHAPADRGLRHFLALGGLTELLVRTKLPPQTDQRLRDIVAHAEREGPKQPAIDLMMTALKRINS